MTTPSIDDYERLKKEQMEVYADMLAAFRNSNSLLSDIIEAMTLADFSDHSYIKRLDDSISNYAVGAQSLAVAFNAYAQSHGVKFDS